MKLSQQNYSTISINSALQSQIKSKRMCRDGNGNIVAMGQCDSGSHIWNLNDFKWLNTFRNVMFASDEARCLSTTNVNWVKHISMEWQAFNFFDLFRTQHCVQHVQHFHFQRKWIDLDSDLNSFSFRPTELDVHDYAAHSQTKRLANQLLCPIRHIPYADRYLRWSLCLFRSFQHSSTPNVWLYVFNLLTERFMYRKMHDIQIIQVGMLIILYNSGLSIE